MKRCLACHQSKPDSEFPSGGALTCNFCTPSSDRLSASIMRGGVDALGSRGNPFETEALIDPSGGLRQPTSIYDGIRTQRATAKDDSVKRLLLNTSRKLDAAVAAGYSPEYTIVDERPLIDRLHEGTFTNARGMSIVDDKYAFRMLLRKAKCFTLDDATSMMVADFSMAIAADLDSARQLAIPPFPVTWIDLNNRLRLGRVEDWRRHSYTAGAGASRWPGG